MLKTAIFVILGFAGTAVLLLVVLAALSRSGKPPGLLDGRLSACPDSPNCVCSEAYSDALHYIEPVAIQALSNPHPLTAIRDVITDMGGVILEDDGAYLAASFSSTLFGFVDDLEVRVEPQDSVIHVRSASRAGYGDAGVNRKRAELFRKLYTEKSAREMHDDS